MKSWRHCQAVQNVQPVAPLHPWIWPWERIHVDSAGPFCGRTFLVSYSKWPEIIQMKSTTTAATVIHLRKLFSAYGLPEQLVSDNGLQFSSTEFAEFLTKNGVKHMKSAPYHPSSNGAVEHFIQTSKKSMRSGEHQGLPFIQLCFCKHIKVQLTPQLMHHLVCCFLNDRSEQGYIFLGQISTAKLLRNRLNKRKHMMNTLMNEHFSLDKE